MNHPRIFSGIACLAVLLGACTASLDSLTVGQRMELCQQARLNAGYFSNTTLTNEQRQAIQAIFASCVQDANRAASSATSVSSEEHSSLMNDSSENDSDASAMHNNAVCEQARTDAGYFSDTTLTNEQRQSIQAQFVVCVQELNGASSRSIQSKSSQSSSVSMRSMNSSMSHQLSLCEEARTDAGYYSDASLTNDQRAVIQARFMACVQATNGPSSASVRSSNSSLSMSSL